MEAAGQVDHTPPSAPKLSTGGTRKLADCKLKLKKGKYVSESATFQHFYNYKSGHPETFKIKSAAVSRLTMPPPPQPTGVPMKYEQALIRMDMDAWGGGAPDTRQIL